MQKVEVGGFQTCNKKMIEVLSRLDDLAVRRCILITGEQGSGRRLYAQELANRKRVQKIIRFKSGGSFLEIKNGDCCVLVEDVESLMPHEQKIISKMIDDFRKTDWIFISFHQVRKLASQGLIAFDLSEKIQAEVNIPALRDRPEDIELISDSVLSTLAWMEGKIKKLDIQAQEKIQSYNWPENVAELEKILEKAFILTEGRVISARNIEIYEMTTQNIRLCTLSEMERKLILQTLEITKHNKSQAARILGISIRTLRNKLSVYRQEGLYESNV